MTLTFKRVLPHLWRGDVSDRLRIYVHGTAVDGFWTSVVQATRIDPDGAFEVFNTESYVGPFDSLDDALGHYQEVP